MMHSLVGYTGFVGSNLAAAHAFAGLFNSKNIASAFDTKPALLLYAGLRAEKFLANSAPEQDLAAVKNAMENIAKIAPERIVLISTVDVYAKPIAVDELAPMSRDGLQPYGAHRLLLEEYVEQSFPKHLIVRLPALFGRGLKKNFIYDFIRFVPSLLKESKYQELAARSEVLRAAYVRAENGFYKCVCAKEELPLLKEELRHIGFSALNFTDSRGVFQFYNLANLWRDIEVALAHDVRRLNLATEPVRIDELYAYLTGKEFRNQITEQPPYYDFYTRYASLYGRTGHYLYSKAEVMRDIKEFVGAVRDEAVDL